MGRSKAKADTDILVHLIKDAHLGTDIWKCTTSPFSTQKGSEICLFEHPPDQLWHINIGSMVRDWGGANCLTDQWQTGECVKHACVHCCQ